MANGTGHRVVDLRRRVAASRVAPLAALPVRLREVGRVNGRTMAESARWLVRSREHTNFTYDLTPRNLEHLAWFVSAVTGTPAQQVRGYINEICYDEDLRSHVSDLTARSERRGLADRTVRFGRRVGWYALVRCLRPEHVVETGTDKGLGSCVMAAALLRNRVGRLTTIDVNPESGYLIAGRYSEIVDRRIGDSISILGELGGVDLLLHDSLHTLEHETAEYDALPPSPSRLVLSDNAHACDALLRWAERNDRRFLFFAEQPTRHWYPGSGIGAAWSADRD
jgi:hypothetical protein